MRSLNYLFILVVIAVTGCKKTYKPSVLSTSNKYLVVEGVINSGSDSTFIKLSRTVKLSSKASSSPELNAIVTVQSDQNTSYPLIEIGNGMYGCAGLNLDNAHQYRLSIKTTNGKQYLSDYIAVLNSPPIDSVSFDTNGTATAGSGINLYVNTHDPANKVKYYRWDYQETWIFHSNYLSYFQSNGDSVFARNLNTDNIHDCWGNDTSSTIILGTTAKLEKSVILNDPITSVLSTSEKLTTEYSILVRQYALTTEAYDFYTNLKKNTEQLGSVFDALPS
ncbi:MAG TPA: DUF4249 domain-containing protein, partial [Mucilaginibacter sp.]|nr:DUF4249 domain-containing protein [Mucilaginibacter sp.]